MPEYRNILYEKQRQGMLITLNRPEMMNTISNELNHELHTALEEAEPTRRSAPSSSPARVGHSSPNTTSKAAAKAVSFRRTGCGRGRGSPRPSTTSVTEHGTSSTAV